MTIRKCHHCGGSLKSINEPGALHVFQIDETEIGERIEMAEEHLRCTNCALYAHIMYDVSYDEDGEVFTKTGEIIYWKSHDDDEEFATYTPKEGYKINPAANPL